MTIGLHTEGDTDSELKPFNEISIELKV